jgi:hypothetical protein
VDDSEESIRLLVKKARRGRLVAKVAKAYSTVLSPEVRRSNTVGSGTEKTGMRRCFP